MKTLQLVNFKIIIITLFLVFVLKMDSYAQNADNSNYPRIEFYSEIDKGDPNSGNQKWTDPNGKTVYGGKREYRPFIIRKTYLINEPQKTQLLKMQLRWLPYFGEQKENITLKQYFEAIINTDRYALYSLLPKNLTEFNSKKETEENYQYYSTLLAYEKSYPTEFTVVWLDKNTWFVNDMYYSFNEDLTKLMQNGKDEIIAEGNFDDFLRLSPIFQYKLTEGFPDIKLNGLKNPIPMDKIVLGIALSPGMPNTNDYNIQITGNGSIMTQGYKSEQKIDLTLLTKLLFEAQNLNLKEYNLNKLKAVKEDDGQTYTISAWKDGVLHQIENPDLSSETSPLSVFVKQVNKALEKYSMSKK